MAKLEGRLVDRRTIAEGTWAFRIAVKPKLGYRAGQTVDLTLPKPAFNDDAGNQRTFSIACAPDDTILIATRVRGSAFKKSLAEGPTDQPIEVEGPIGSFTLPNRPQRVVLLAGGIGITPFRAMAEDAINRRLEHHITIVHSNRTPEETPFLEELRSWAVANDRFVYMPTMTQMEHSKASWSGEHRRVGPELLATVAPADRNAALYYVAGPDRFVKGVADSLKTFGVDEDQIRAEEFPGY